jgi:hypothetical protein
VVDAVAFRRKKEAGGDGTGEERREWIKDEGKKVVDA